MIPLKKALLKIALSVLAISGSAWLIYGVYFALWRQRVYDPRYELVAILQSVQKGEELKTDYLSELLGLKVELPINLYLFNLEEGEKRLKASPLISHAKLKRFPPGTLFVSYGVKEPVGYVEDVENTAFDKEGFLFPYKPFFSPKKLPLVRFDDGALTLKYGTRIDEKKLALLNEVFKELSFVEAESGIIPVKIDISKIAEPGLGEARLVIVFEDGQEDPLLGIKKEWNLILSDQEWKEGLDRFLKIIKSGKLSFNGRHLAIDLRLPKQGFILHGTSN